MINTNTPAPSGRQGHFNNARPRITVHAVSPDERSRQPDG